MAFSLVGTITGLNRFFYDFAVTPGRDFIYLALDEGLRRLTYPDRADAPWPSSASYITGSLLVPDEGDESVCVGVTVDAATGDVFVSATDGSGDYRAYQFDADGEQLAHDLLDLSMGAIESVAFTGTHVVGVDALSGSLWQLRIASGSANNVKLYDPADDGFSVSEAYGPSVAPDGAVWFTFRPPGFLPNNQVVRYTSGGTDVFPNVNDLGHTEGVALCDSSYGTVDNTAAGTRGTPGGIRIPVDFVGAGGEQPYPDLDFLVYEDEAGPFGYLAEHMSFTHTGWMYLATPRFPVDVISIYESRCAVARNYIGLIGN